MMNKKKKSEEQFKDVNYLYILFIFIIFICNYEYITGKYSIDE